MSRTTFSRTAAASLLALSGALGAQGALAQQAGTYTGVTSEGLPISIIVESDGVGGFVFTQNQTQWTMTCTKGGNHTGYWYVGAYEPIVAGKVSWEFKSDFLYEKMKLKWNGSGTQVTGDFAASEPLFVDISTSTKQYTRCDSQVGLTFAAQLQPPIAAEAAPTARPQATRMVPVTTAE